jgi:hypothetical protein
MASPIDSYVAKLYWNCKLKDLAETYVKPCPVGSKYVLLNV